MMALHSLAGTVLFLEVSFGAHLLAMARTVLNGNLICCNLLAKLSTVTVLVHLVVHAPVKIL